MLFCSKNINYLAFLDEFLSCKNKTLIIFNNDSSPNAKHFLSNLVLLKILLHVQRLFIKRKINLWNQKNFLGRCNFERLLLLSAILVPWFFLKYWVLQLILADTPVLRCQSNRVQVLKPLNLFMSSCTLFWMKIYYYLLF